MNFGDFRCPILSKMQKWDFRVFGQKSNKFDSTSYYSTKTSLKWMFSSVIMQGIFLLLIAVPFIAWTEKFVSVFFFSDGYWLHFYLSNLELNIAEHCCLKIKTLLQQERLFRVIRSNLNIGQAANERAIKGTKNLAEIKRMLSRDKDKTCKQTNTTRNIKWPKFHIYKITQVNEQLGLY